MSSVECLREFVNERLTAAAEEIFGAFRQTVVEYEEEIDRQRRLLDIFRKPEVKLHRIELPQQHVCKEEEEEVLADQQLCIQERNSSLDQEEPEPPQVKEEQEELCSSQEGEQLVLKQETDTFMLTPTYEESDHSGPEPKSDQQLLSHNCHVAESQDQKGGEPEDSGSTRDAEPEQKNQGHKRRSLRNNVHNSTMSEVHQDPHTATTNPPNALPLAGSCACRGRQISPKGSRADRNNPNMEDDDLDELLDEVEKKFCSNVSVASSAREPGKCMKDNAGRTKHSPTKPKLPICSVSEDIDALLEELLEEDYGDSPQLKTEQFSKGTQVEKKQPPSQSGGRKCCPVFVGGSSVTNGVGTATSKRSCDQLRCISCDFRVLMFDDCEWDSSCDYLFLRNNMPDRQKLRAKLKRRRGLRAYACQCSWVSAIEPADLRDRPQLRWVCGKHQD